MSGSSFEIEGEWVMSNAATRTCTNCGVSLNETAQFCHACGAQQGADTKPLPPALIGLVALAIVVVVAVVAYSAGRSSGPPAPPTTAAAPFASGGGGGAPPDISNLTPREQADRLFNLVMTAHEQGDVARMTQFTPMAINAYQALGTLDPDAHYHVGLISAITGDLDEALARADSMDALVPGHLLASMLRNSVAQMGSDQAARLAAQRAFLENYDAQITSGRPEYIDHQRSIEPFKTQAETAVGGGG
jgi:hypothetical protein